MTPARRARNLAVVVAIIGGLFALPAPVAGGSVIGAAVFVGGLFVAAAIESAS